VLAAWLAPMTQTTNTSETSAKFAGLYGATAQKAAYYVCPSNDQINAFFKM
jgi:hypothetical protein